MYNTNFIFIYNFYNCTLRVNCNYNNTVSWHGCAKCEIKLLLRLIFGIGHIYLMRCGRSQLFYAK